MANDIYIYIDSSADPLDFDIDPYGVATCMFDLMIEGLGESSDIEIQKFVGELFQGVVILKDTTATDAALEELKALPWVGSVM